MMQSTHFSSPLKVISCRPKICRRVTCAVHGHNTNSGLKSSLDKAGSAVQKAWKSSRNAVEDQIINYNGSVDDAMDSFVSIIMPKERGDWRDHALMAFSLVLFCCIGAQMYGIYLHLYMAAGLKPILHYR